MSDTPRTDEAEIRCIDEPVHPLGMVEVDFARQLERELNAANERIKRLEEALNTCDHNFSRSAPDEGSRNGDSWQAVREALGRPNPWEKWTP